MFGTPPQVTVLMLQQQPSSPGAALAHTHAYWLMCAWAVVDIGYLLRFTSLGSDVNKKLQAGTLLNIAQINAQLRLLKAPHKKAELGVTTSMLKSAVSMLKV